MTDEHAAQKKADQPEKPQVQTDCEERFASFLQRNPKSYLITNTSNDDPFCVIRSPWNDPSLGILLPRPNRIDAAFEDALNNVILPERLSAIFHKDRRQLEVIWTAFKLPAHLREIGGRAFTFQIAKDTYKCEYKRSSERLLSIAKGVVLYGDTGTKYRNMESFVLYTDNPDDPAEKERLDTPLSLFIDDIDWNEDKVVNILRNLNFYLSYFDSASPHIEIHEQDLAESQIKRNRYIDDSFPGEIQGRDLNPTLAAFWSAASFEGDPARRYLYYYRLIEYVSFFHLEDAVRSGVKRTLSGPNALGNIAEVTDKVVALIRDSRADEYARFKSTITDLVDKKHIDREIALNPSLFSKDISFDGGFVLKALITDPKSPNIGAHGIENFVTTLRDIRNALSHGRDQKTGQVILPTSSNLKKIQPWVNLIRNAAAEVILYEGIS